MAKQNYTAALDNLLKTYGKDRAWLARLLDKDEKSLDAFLGSKKTTLGELQALLSKAGISLYLTVRGETPPTKGSPRLQFLKNNFRRHRNEPIVAEVTSIRNAPQCWYDADDIPLKDLYDVENSFGMTFQWNFNGMSEAEDTMLSSPLRSHVRKTLRQEMLKKCEGFDTIAPQEEKPQKETTEPTSVEENNPKGLNADNLIAEIKEIFKEEIPWFIEILQKNKTEEDLFFNIKEGTTLQKLDDVYSKKTMSALREYLKEKGYDVSVRIWSDTRLGEPYRSQFNGFLWKWMDDGGYTMEQVRTWVAQYFKDYADPVDWKRDDDLPLNSLQVIADMTGVKLSVILLSTEDASAFRDNNMMAFIIPNRRVKSLQSTLSQKRVRKSLETQGETPAQKPTKAITVKDWLELHPDFAQLRDRTPKERQGILDGRYGENTVIALFPFDVASDINFIKLHKELLEQIAVKRVIAQKTAEADLDTTIIVTENRESIIKLDCIEEIQDKLSSVPKAQEMVFEKPLTTQKGKIITGIIWSPSEGLALEGEKKGFLIRKKEKIMAVNGHPEVLAELFDRKTWYMITKKAREHYRLFGIQRIKETLSGAKRHVEDIRTKLTALHSAAVQDIMATIAETQGMNLTDGFVEMIGNKIYAAPVLSEGRIWFDIADDDDNSNRRVAAEDIKTETLLALNELLIEHIDKMLNL